MTDERTLLHQILDAARDLLAEETMREDAGGVCLEWIELEDAVERYDEHY